MGADLLVVEMLSGGCYILIKHLDGMVLRSELRTPSEFPRRIYGFSQIMERKRLKNIFNCTLYVYFTLGTLRLMVF